MCGPTSPMKPMAPTKATAVADSRLTRSSDRKRSRFTSTPKLMARSSPSRSAVRAREDRSEKGVTTTSTTARAATLLQVARDSDPMVQNTSCCSASAEDRNCTSAVRALKAKTRAMPNRTMLSIPDPFIRARACSASTEPKAKTKAFSGTSQSAPMKEAPRPSTMASDAPNEAAEETPSVKGLASGLFSTVCISAPARARAAPTIIAIRA